MPEIVIVEFNGTEHRVKAEPGQSVMQVAQGNMIPGILADCGGNCSCATCHVYLDPAWKARVPEASSNEKEMIDCALYVTEQSRLSCQIKITEDLEGLIVRLPESQT